MSLRSSLIGCAVVVALGCAGPGRQAGEDCIFNGDCADPLVCAGHRCRAPCRDDRDCTNAWRCRPSGGSGPRVCLAPSEHGFCATARDCDPPAVCGVTGVCGSQCAAAYDCALRGASAACAPTQQDRTLMLCTDNPAWVPVPAGP